MKAYAGRWLGVALLVLACAKPSPPVESRSATPSTLPSVQPMSEEAPAPLASCRDVGPLGCNLPPSTPSALCGALGPCIAEPPDLNLEGLAIECNRPGASEAERTLATETLAPERTGLAAVGVANLLASDDTRAMFGASYLVARVGDGWCLVDNVLEWEIHRSYFETDFSMRWEPAPSGSRLFVEAHRVGHESLDQEELASGESDVTSETCRHLVYDVSGGRVTRVSDSSKAGACG